MAAIDGDNSDDDGWGACGVAAVDDVDDDDDVNDDDESEVNFVLLGNKH